MTNHAVDSSSPALVAVLQMLLSAQGLEDVRDATAHGARLVSRYDALSLYEVQEAGALEPTLRSGDDLGPGSKALEELLCGRASSAGRTVSTLDRFVSTEDQSVVNEYMGRYGLCLARPLSAYGESIGVLVTHYANRVALAEAEFDTLRRYAEFAAVALSSARTRAELRSFAYSDPLTGLANRRWLEVEFKRLEGTQVSLLLIDFDGLKTVNDTLGYDRGDALINAVGARLGANARPGEIAVRYGGDEFVLIMPETDRSAAVQRAEEMTLMLEEFTLPEDLAALFQGASVGSATAEAGEDLWEVLSRASTEMQLRKRRRKTDREPLSDGEADLRFGRET